MHKLAERGLLDVHDPVAEYIPGYEKHGKRKITVGHVLAHRAAVPNLPKTALELENLGNREFMIDLLVDAVPFAKPGKYLAYHAVSGGFILGEIVHAVTGKNIRQVLEEEFLDPLHFRWMNYGVKPDDVDKVAVNYITGPPTARRCRPCSRGCSASTSTAWSTSPTTPLPDRDRAGRQHGDQRVGVEPFLRGHALRRGTGRGPGDADQDDPSCAGGAVPSGDRPVDGLPDPLLLRTDARVPVLSIYGRNTQHAFGHLGFTNILAWADPVGDLGRRAQQRQADLLSGDFAFSGHHGGDHQCHAASAQCRAHALDGGASTGQGRRRHRCREWFRRLIAQKCAAGGAKVVGG